MYYFPTTVGVYFQSAFAVVGYLMLSFNDYSRKKGVKKGITTIISVKI